MARITLRQLLDHAAEHGYGVPAFNINNMEQGLAIMEAAAAADAPVIIQASRGARAYANDIVLAKSIEALIELYPDIQDRFNAHGGAMRQTNGVPVEEIVRGIKHGVRKVNIDTDCRLAMTAELRRVAHETPGEFDPRKFLKPAMDAMRAVCRQRLEQFGTAGNASRIKVLPMSAMAKRYASGSLDPALNLRRAAAE